VRATKRSLALSANATLEEQLDQEAREQALGYESADLLEGLAAARERRTPRFTGR
jgi:enoyl-CoA hydratase/carnithine racemase